MKRLPWILLFLTLALVAWLALAIVHAENQRNALYNKACPEHGDAQCLALVESRAHWWNHLAYALTHLRP